MSASSTPRLGAAPDTRFESHSRPAESTKRKRSISQEQIDALIIKARADWAEDAKKRALSQSTSSPLREPYSPQLKKQRHLDENSEKPADPREITPTNYLPQKDPGTSSTLSPETLDYCERLKQKMKEAMEQRQAPEVTAINQKWKMSLGYLSNPEQKK
ncbi:MAG: hypothetical protein JSR39_01505 [Verrucomicrobia bacterium]|nr:hypothetical protein [Verrucomicrobiota bacterium]